MKSAWVPLIAAVALAASPQQSQKKQSPPQKQEPLFQGPIRIKSAQQKKESAAMGFNGVDPTGKVELKVLSTPASSADEQKVKALAQNRPGQAELAAFLKEGGLNAK